MSKIGLGVIGGIVVLIAIVMFSYFYTKYSYINKEIVLRERIESQTQKNKDRFDTQFKIIAGKAQVTEKNTESFKEVYIGLMTARYGKDGRQEGGMMNVLQENNPNFSNELYKELMQTIEEQKLSFEREQSILISLGQEHNTLIKQFPGSWFLSDIKPIEIKLVTSAKTKKVFETGEDNDIDIFSPKK